MDKLEEEIPASLVIEWNEYLNYELEQLAKAVLSALPAAGSLAGSGGNGPIRIKDPEEIGNFLSSIGAMKNG